MYDPFSSSGENIWYHRFVYSTVEPTTTAARCTKAFRIAMVSASASIYDCIQCMGKENDWM